MSLEGLLDRDDLPADVRATIVEHLAELDRVERARLDRELRFRQLAETTYEAIGIHRDGVLLDANAQYFLLFGYERDELLGKQVVPLTVAPESREHLMRQVTSGSPGPCPRASPTRCARRWRRCRAVARPGPTCLRSLSPTAARC